MRTQPEVSHKQEKLSSCVREHTYLHYTPLFRLPAERCRWSHASINLHWSLGVDKATIKLLAGLAISWVTDEFIRRVHSRGSVGKSCLCMELYKCTHTHTRTCWRHTPRHQTPLWHTPSRPCESPVQPGRQAAWGKATRDMCALPVWLQWYHHWEEIRTHQYDGRHTAFPFCAGYISPTMTGILLLHKTKTEQGNGWRYIWRAEKGSKGKYRSSQVVTLCYASLQREKTCLPFGNTKLPLTLH